MPKPNLPAFEVRSQHLVEVWKDQIDSQCDVDLRLRSRVERVFYVQRDGYADVRLAVVRGVVRLLSRARLRPLSICSCESRIGPLTVDPCHRGIRSAQQALVVPRVQHAPRPTARRIFYRLTGPFVKQDQSSGHSARRQLSDSQARDERLSSELGLKSLDQQQYLVGYAFRIGDQSFASNYKISSRVKSWACCSSSSRGGSCYQTVCEGFGKKWFAMASSLSWASIPGCRQPIFFMTTL